MTTPREVLDFWFERPGVAEGRPAKVWFQKDSEFDELIRERFEASVGEALAGELDEWSDEPEGALALILLLDQFTRNIYRGTPKAFAGDRHACGLSRMAIEREYDERVPVTWRAFFYMPLEHAEYDSAQEESVAAFEQLLENADDSEREAASNFLNYARRHKEVIDRFGRFPHRNEILGRESTPAELEFLKTPNSRF